MPKAKVYRIGPYVGTMVELAKIPDVQVPSMCKRIKKYYSGEYTLEQCFEKKLPVKDMEDVGNAEWHSLSRYVKDARMKLENIPSSFAKWGV